MTQNIKVSLLESNTGQIEGLPKNPRFIKDDRFKALVKSLQDTPEMLELRPILVFQVGKKFVIIGGNMRYRASLELGYKELPCKVISSDTPVEKLRAYTIKDNVAFGQNDFDILANEWDEFELLDFGMEVWDTSDDTDYSSKNKELDANDFEDEMIFKLKFSESDYNLVKDALSKISNSPETALLKLISNV
jgi:ParB-like nuclease domain